jgi:uncharacterized protein YjbI with pentapeptide repeats
VPGFAHSSDFAFDKAPGHPCPNLAPDFRCSIHERLREDGFGGCAAYDCFGAGQHLAQVTFEGKDWLEHPEVRADMSAAFPVMRALHELLWYLSEAVALLEAAGAEVRGRDAPDLLDGLREEVEESRRLADGSPERLAQVDVDALRHRANRLLLRAGERVRSGAGHDGADLRGADLVGQDLRHADLRGAGLRGALLIGTDLREVDLDRADLTGADLRGADLRGADLSGALFLTRSQVASARGDSRTRLPAGVDPPSHWT